MNDEHEMSTSVSLDCLQTAGLCMFSGLWATLTASPTSPCTVTGQLTDTPTRGLADAAKRTKN